MDLYIAVCIVIVLIMCLFSHRTVEVTNTDAEGRLVLADGVCYPLLKTSLCYSFK